MRRGEAAAGDRFASPAAPRHLYILAMRHKLDQVSRSAEEGVAALAVGKVHGGPDWAILSFDGPTDHQAEDAKFDQARNKGCRSLHSGQMLGLESRRIGRVAELVLEIS